MAPYSVGIVGGGPGGLLTAYCLQKRASLPHHITIFEASPRLGGKILTGQFRLAPVRYEAGAAELYDYSVVGPDPLRDLIDELGLPTAPMDGDKVVMNHCGQGIDHGPRWNGNGARGWGPAASDALHEFDLLAKEWMSPRRFYDSDWREGEEDPIAATPFDAILAGIPDATTRRYVQALVHSDLATEPHQTNAVYGLQNYLMNDPAYLRLYTIDGGIERLPRELAGRINAEVRLNQPVLGVHKTSRGALQVVSRRAGQAVESEFDFVVVALPNHLLPSIDWGDGALAEAVRRHHAHYDYPAHYLRVTILFDQPFWRPHLKESYFMLDAFGGCCVYDESSRNGGGRHGVLGWLLGGDAARTMSALPDDDLVRQMLESLPPPLHQGRDCFLEGRVHRWVDEVNGLPAGYPQRPLAVRHRPEPVGHPNLWFVGDYLFDSTLNGVLDSADYVAEWLWGEMAQRSLAAVSLGAAPVQAASALACERLRVEAS